MGKTLIQGIDYVVRAVDFGSSAADGVVVSGPDGVATICINSRVCPTRQRKALKHELNHLKCGDFYNGMCIEDIELRADMAGRVSL